MAGSSLQAVCEARVGKTLRGKWTLEKVVGIGGMAAVYVAAHKIGRREAVKILHPEIARSKELVLRFEQEAKAVNRFSHPGAVEIRDIDTSEDGCPFLVMELLEGENLAERASRLGGLPREELLAHVEVLLDVLSAAHAQGIVHRDVKLDNLFVTSDGKLKVLDFGIARVTSGPALTRLGARLGTTAYMAPEQVRGEEIDGRTDVFAVGATMFRVTAKRRIHDAPNETELMIKMASDPAPSLGAVLPDADRGLVLVVDRALEFTKTDRYPDAATMQSDVRALRAGGQPPYATERASAPRTTRSAFASDPTRAPGMASDPTRAPGFAMEATAAPLAPPLAVPRPQRTIAIAPPPPGSLMVPSVAAPSVSSPHVPTPLPVSVSQPHPMASSSQSWAQGGYTAVAQAHEAPPASLGPGSFGPPHSNLAHPSVAHPSAGYPSTPYPSGPYPSVPHASVAPLTPHTSVSPSGPPPKKASSAPIIAAVLVAVGVLGAVGLYLALPASKPVASASSDDDDDDDDDDDRPSKKKSDSAAASASPAAQPTAAPTPAAPAEDKKEKEKEPAVEEREPERPSEEAHTQPTSAPPKPTGKPAEMPQPTSQPTSRPTTSPKSKEKTKGKKPK